MAACLRERVGPSGPEEEDNPPFFFWLLLKKEKGEGKASEVRERAEWREER